MLLSEPFISGLLVGFVAGALGSYALRDRVAFSRSWIVFGLLACFGLIAGYLNKASLGGGLPGGLAIGGVIAVQAFWPHKYK